MPSTKVATREKASEVSKASSVKSTVLSLAKGFRILEVFDAQERELSLSQIGQKAGLDPGTTFRLVKTLVMMGYLRQVDGAKRYYLGLKVLDLGFNAIARMDLQSTARPVLRSLVGQVNEAASICVLDGADVVYIERVQAGLVRLGVNTRIGSRIPAYCSGVGHAILAHLPFERRLEILNMRERAKLTPYTPVTIPEIEERLTSVRELGYALSDQDTVLGVRVIAAPILDRDGHPWGALSVAEPTFNSSLETFVASSAGPVVNAAQDLARVLSIAGSTTAEA